MKPVFLISLPRSGSTLFQRLLMEHDQIASKSEPWIMLPLVYMLKERGSVAEYDHRLAHIALEDFIKDLPQQQSDLYPHLRAFALNLYALHCRNGETFFLDKTPRYYLIIDELVQIFPDARFIFLVRNPVQIMASIVSTFSNNTLRNLHFYHIDIFRGFDLMAKGIEKYGNRSIVIRYENIVEDHQAVMEKVCSYLDLHWLGEGELVLNNNGLTGRMGDKRGAVAYKAVQDTGMDKWKEVFRERARCYYLKKVINSLDSQTLETYGYKKEELLEGIRSINVKTTLGSIRDIGHITSSALIKKFYLNLYRPRVREWSRDTILN